jgi:hypothetical protein
MSDSHPWIGPKSDEGTWPEDLSPSPYEQGWTREAWIGCAVDEGLETDDILSAFLPSDRLAVARYLNDMGGGFVVPLDHLGDL